jgi:hypothetical protein
MATEICQAEASFCCHATIEGKLARSCDQCKRSLCKQCTKTGFMCVGCNCWCCAWCGSMALDKCDECASK